MTEHAGEDAGARAVAVRSIDGQKLPDGPVAMCGAWLEGEMRRSITAMADLSRIAGSGDEADAPLPLAYM